LDAEERLRGYRRALLESQLVPSETLEISGNFLEEAGYDAAKKILELRPRPTAIFAANDSMAIGALSALREIGIAIPQEMALAGFDDVPIARFLSPTLTTVRVFINGLGGIAIQKLVQAIREKNNHAKQHVVIPTSLALRESCGCPKPH
jgi:LacI family transcriptional regulator